MTAPALKLERSQWAVVYDTARAFSSAELRSRADQLASEGWFDTAGVLRAVARALELEGR